MEDREKIKERRRARKEAEQREQQRQIQKKIGVRIGLGFLIIVLLTIVLCLLLSRQVELTDETTISVSGIVTDMDQVSVTARRKSAKLVTVELQGEWYSIPLNHIEKAGWSYDSFREDMIGQQVDLQLSPKKSALYVNILRWKQDGEVLIDLYDITNKNAKAITVILYVVYVLFLLAVIAETVLRICGIIYPMSGKRKK